MVTQHKNTNGTTTVQDKKGRFKGTLPADKSPTPLPKSHIAHPQQSGYLSPKTSTPQRTTTTAHAYDYLQGVGHSSATHLPEALEDLIDLSENQPFTVTHRNELLFTFGGNRNALVREDDGTVTVTFREGYGTLGETRFSHMAPEQAFLVSAHIAMLSDVATITQD